MGRGAADRICMGAQFASRVTMLSRALLFAFLVACSSEPDSVIESPPGTSEVVDATGSVLALPEAPPQRIVAVGKGVYMVLHLLFMFPEAGEQLVAVEQRGKGVTQFVGGLDPAEDPWEMLAVEPGVEAVASLRPDLVLTKGTVLGERAGSLARLGIPSLHLGLESPERFVEDVSLLGTVLEQPERADEIVGFYEQRLERIRSGVEDLAEDARPRVLMAAWHARGGEVAVKVPARGWMQTQQVELAGGRPVWVERGSISDGWTIVGFEQIAAWDPEVVVLSVPRDLDERELVASLREDGQWGLLRAVERGQLHAFPHDLYDWNSPDPRWILGLSWMASTLHPERFVDLDPEAELRAFYGELYGLSPERVEDWILPEVRLGGV